MQTSTVTVAVLDVEQESCFSLPPGEVDITTTRGSGPGGQNRNKVESCVVATHVPTGIRVRIDMKSQQQSRKIALGVLAARVREQQEAHSAQSRAAERKQQLGSGMRGDKRRSYRSQNDHVVDHVTGQSWQLKKWLRGDW